MSGPGRIGITSGIGCRFRGDGGMVVGFLSADAAFCQRRLLPVQEMTISHSPNVILALKRGWACYNPATRQATKGNWIII